MMAYDPDAGYVVMYGGESPSQTFLADTWTYKAGAWNELSISDPPARAYGSMSWDAADGEIVLFGGLESTSGALASDTWTFSGGSWNHDTSSTNNPSARDFAQMTYDTADGYVFLFGGDTSSGGNTESWKFVGGQWTNLGIAAIDAPPDLAGSMVFDAYDGYVLYVGYPSGESTESWDYQGGSWNELIGVNTEPPADAPPFMAYDSNDQEVMLEEWASSGEETWFFHGDMWYDVTGTSGAPSPETYNAMTYDGADAEAIFVDLNGNNLNTWNYPGAPSVSVSANLPGVDVGETVDFTATTTGGVPPFSYSWSGLPQGCSNINENPLPCIPTGTNPSSVVVSVTDSGSRQAQSPAYPITVSPAPSVATPKGSEPSADDYEPITFSTSVSGGPQTYEVYSWPHLPSGCSSANMSTLPCTPTSPGTYSVQVDVTDGNHDALTSTAISYVILANPTVTLQANRTVLDIGQKIQFWANASGGSGAYSFWYQGLPCATANLSLLVCTPSATGTYSVTVEINDTLGGTASSGTVPFVVKADVTLSTSWTQGSASDYANATLTLKLTYGSGNPNYRPCLDAVGSDINGLVCGSWQGGSSYSFGFWYTQAGSYTLVASIEDSTGWNTTSTLAVNVYWPLFTSGASLPFTLDQGMTANGTLVVHHGIPGYSVWWNDTTASATLCTATPSSDGASVCPFVPGWTGTHSIEVTVRDSGWGSSYANLSLAVNAALGSLALSATVGTFSAHAGGTLEDEVGANVAFSASFSGGTSPYTTTWSYNGSFVMGSGSSLTFTWVHTGSYTVTFLATDSLGKSISGTITVVVYPSASGLTLSSHLSQLDVGTSDNISLNFSGGLSPFSFTWNMGDGTIVTSSHPWFVHAWASSGSFTVTLTIQDAAGGRTSTTLQVVVQPDPAISEATASAGGTTSGAGGTLGTLVNQTVSFSALFTGGLGPYHYQWMANSTLLGSGVGTGPWFNLTYAWNGSGSFTATFTVTDVQGHTSTASLTVVVRPDLFTSIFLGSSWAQPDAGVSTNLTLSFQGGVGPFSYGWILGDGSGTYTSTPWLTHAYSTPGTYTITVVIRDSLGGTGSASLRLTVVSALTVACAPVANTSKVWAGETVTLSLGCVGGGTQPYTYAWAFGDGGHQKGMNSVSHAFVTAGNYSVVVLVNDSGGSSIHSLTLSVQVLTLGEVLPYISGASYQVGTSFTNGASKEVRLNLSVHAATEIGTLSWVKISTSMAGLASASWIPVVGAFLWVNVTSANDTPTLYIQVENSLNRTSAVYPLATNLASLFPGQGPGNGGGNGGLPLGELFLIVVGVTILALVAILLVALAVRKRKGGKLTSSGTSGPSEDKVTAAIQERVAKDPGVGRDTLVKDVASATRTSEKDVDLKVEFLVATSQLVESEAENGQKTYTSPTVGASATLSPQVTESLAHKQKVDLLVEEVAKRGEDLIPMDELLPFAQTLGLDQATLAAIIGANSEMNGAFCVEADPSGDGLLVSLSPAKKAARSLPPVTAEPVIAPQFPANENFVHTDEGLPRVRIQTDTNASSSGQCD